MLSFYERTNLMTIFSEDGHSNLVFDHVNTQDKPLPSLCFHVHVHTPQFTGEMGRLWFEWDAVIHFMTGLRALETTRNGAVRLETMSAGEFALEIYSLNARGNLAARFRFAGKVPSGTALFPYEFHSGFPIDPISLPLVISSMAQHQITS
jgi:hypothetical protein